MRVAIVGVGLIGGSLGMRLRSSGFAEKVVGCGRDRANLEIALARGCIDIATSDPAEAVQGANLVVLATPVRTIVELLPRIAGELAPETVVTDVGSVKVPIVRAAQGTLPWPERFVGGHPIAGTEESGAAAADPTLFEGARWILTPEGTAPDAVARVQELVRATGARLEELDPEVHDRIFAWASHLPHLIAFALGAALADEGEVLFAYGGGGLQDMIRIAASDPVMWRDIFAVNRESLLAALARFRTALSELEALLDDPEGLAERLRAIRTAVRRGRGGLGEAG